MEGNSRFSYRTLDELCKDIEAMNLFIPLSEDTQILAESIYVEGRKIPNRLCIHPMEGHDADPNGAPGELTFRRYTRYAQGGAGIIWIEATAVVPEGKAHPRQLWINEDSVKGFKTLVEVIKENSLNLRGQKQLPFVVLQLTHSGRQSCPEGVPFPIITHHSRILDVKDNLSPDYPIISDQELDKLQEKFIEASQMAYECGFDAVDIKACHGYLLHELLFSYTRENSKYGGSFENRTRFLREVIEKVKKIVPEIILTTRLNIYDGVPYPWGWGVKKDGSVKPDLSEPIALIKKLKELGVNIINIAVGNPYYNPHLERPYDHPIAGGYVPDEHPLKTISRNIRLTFEIASRIPQIRLIGTGFSWLRQFFPNVGAAMVKKRWISFLGVGRVALANPYFANELLSKGNLTKNICITCSSCSQMMKDGGPVGCVVHDSEIYGSLYRFWRLKNKNYLKTLAERCIQCFPPPCQEGCPARMDIPAFIRAFLEGDIKKSYQIMRKDNILPEICAYLCPSERLCEEKCTSRIIYKEEVPIREIQKFVAEEARKRGYAKVSPGRSSGKKVAVVGFGPAGIACSAYLVERGHQVTVFEALEYGGGQAMSSIPDERISREIVRAEIDGLKLKETGLFEIRYKEKLGENQNLDSIMEQGYAAVFLGIGLQESVRLEGGIGVKGVMDALTFLKTIKTLTKKDLLSEIKDGEIAVIGGGATALDVALEAIKLGARDVYLLYRRSLREMPIWSKLREEAMSKGVHLMLLAQPVEYVVDGNNLLQGVKVALTRLGDLDSSGRRIPEKLGPDSEYILPVSVCIEAIGQKIPQEVKYALNGVNFDSRGLIKVDQHYQTSRKGVFAGGDIVNGGGTVVRAVADGLHAAKAIDNYLKEMSS